MKVIFDHELTTVTLLPVEVEEFQVLINLLGMLKPEDKLVYDGKMNTSNGPFYDLAFKFEEATLILHGSTDEDKKAIRRLRDVCFFGSGGLIFLTDTAEGQRGIVATAVRCKHCNAPIIDMFRCEWNTCKTCAEKCEHVYERGMVHGGSAQILAMGEFCIKCGRGNPKKAPEEPIIKHGESKMVCLNDLS